MFIYSIIQFRMTNLAKHLENINSELDDCIETSENILDELKIQDKQIDKISNLINNYSKFYSLWYFFTNFTYKPEFHNYVF